MRLRSVQGCRLRKQADELHREYHGAEESAGRACTSGDLVQSPDDKRALTLGGMTRDMRFRQIVQARASDPKGSEGLRGAMRFRARGSLALSLLNFGGRDWTRGPDVTLVMDCGSLPEVSANLATDDLNAVLSADAVLVVLSKHDGRGMFLYSGPPSPRPSRGDLKHVVILGPIQHESVFFYHPAVQRVSDVDEWLASLV